MSSLKKGSERMKSIKKILEEGRKLYNEGKWKEAKDLLCPLLEVPKGEVPDTEISEHRRLLGWCYYYLGKKNIEDPKESGEWAETCWEDVIVLGVSEDDVSSALTGKPLVYFYLLKDDKKAIKAAKERVEKAPDIKTKKVALNSEGCIERDSGLIAEALKTFSEALKLPQEPGKDIRTTASLLNNRAVTLMKIIPHLTTSRKAAIEETKDFFEQAKDEYRKSEEATGESAKFHLDRIKEKLEGLKV